MLLHILQQAAVWRKDVGIPSKQKKSLLIQIINYNSTAGTPIERLTRLVCPICLKRLKAKRLTHPIECLILVSIFGGENL